MHPLRLVAAAALLPALAACGLQPMYAGGAASRAVRGLAAVQVEPIAEREGWLVRNALRDKLNPDNVEVAPEYRLEVQLDENLEGFGLLTDDTIGRERLTLRARYQLIDIGTGAILLDGTAGSDAGIDVVSSEYATIAAEQTALENLAQDVAARIVTRLALELREES